MTRNRILLVEDEPAVSFGVRDFLESHHYEVACAETCQEGLELFRSWQPDAVIHDYMLPDGNAFDFLPRLKEIEPGTPIIILTGVGSIDLAVRAIQEGAQQFLTKPVALPALLVILQRLIDTQRIRKKQAVGKSLQDRTVIDPFKGKSAAIRKLAEEAKRVLNADSTVLIQGETGTGKGVLAAWLHNNGPRSEEAFVDMNCAGFSRELLETELFGHEKGAFTGATANKMGLFEVAHRGTVFLDEIGDMDPQIQPKLLKVLEEKRFRRLGEVRDRQVDIRLIAASHQDLNALVEQKKFRSDLYFRISTIPLFVPPLRERVEDIPQLAQDLLDRIAADTGRGSLRLASDAAERLEKYSWPGNVRELRNALERAALHTEGSVVTRDYLLVASPSGAEQPGSDGANLTLLEVERLHIARVLRAEHGNVDNAAQRLGIPRSSLYQKIKRHRIALSRV